MSGTIRRAGAMTAVLGLAALGMAACGTGGSTGYTGGDGNTQHGTHTGNPEKAAKPERQAKPAKVKFVVKGQAAQGVDITYGSDADSRDGSNRVPWSATLRADDSVAYYDVTAQLNGSGDITCAIYVGGKLIRRGHAAGSYNICEAQVSPGLTGGWDGY